MRVDHDTAGDSECRAQDHVGRLPPHSGQLDQGLQIPGYVSRMLSDKFLRATLDVLGLAAKKTRALDDSFQCLQRRQGQGGGRGIVAKQLGRYLIDAFIRALRRKNGGDQQLKRGFMIQGAGRLRVQPLELAGNLASVLLLIRQSHRSVIPSRAIQWGGRIVIAVGCPVK